MRHRDIALLLFSVISLCVASHSEEKPWREIRSPHFRVITNGSEGAGRHVAREFEQMRAVFASQFPGYRLEAAEPIIIMAPADESSTRKLVPEFWKHGGPKPAGVYFQSWEQPYALVRLDAVGSDRSSSDQFAVVYHEYVHSLVHLNVHWIPTWLDEGFAEFYAYTRFEGSRTYIGAPPRDMGALSLLRFRSPIPLAKFLDQRGSFSKSEEDTELYYAQCWAMTHYLTMGNDMEGGARLKKFFNAIQQGVEQKKAFQETFGDLGQVQKNFDDYIHLFAFQADVIATPANLEDKNLLARVMTSAESEAELSSFYAATHQWKLAQDAGEQALKHDPKLALAHQGMGFIFVQQGKDDDAGREFAQAVDLDSRMYRGLFAKTMLSPVSHSKSPADQQSFRLDLLKIVQVNPQFAPAYVELAKLSVAQGETTKALGLALKAEKLEPWRAGYHLLTGQILLRVNRTAEAASYAVYVADHWTSPDHDEAMELWNLVPATERPAQGPAPTPKVDGVSRVEGIVRSVTCGENDRALIIEKEGKPLRFHLQHASGGFADTLWFGEDHFTTCYHTTGLRVVVEFKPATDKSYDGEVVMFGFRDDLPAATPPAGTSGVSQSK